jgi:hypothetical protein
MLQVVLLDDKRLDDTGFSSASDPNEITSLEQCLIVLRDRCIQFKLTALEVFAIPED